MLAFFTKSLIILGQASLIIAALVAWYFKMHYHFKYLKAKGDFDQIDYFLVFLVDPITRSEYFESSIAVWLPIFVGDKSQERGIPQLKSIRMKVMLALLIMYSSIAFSSLVGVYSK